MENLKIDDSFLQCKKVIGQGDIYQMLPPKIKHQIRDICVLIRDGKPLWVLFTHNDLGGYLYVPHSGLLEYDCYAKSYFFGKIYLGRKGRYLRKESVREGNNKNLTYSTYLCLRYKMILLAERKEYWVEDDRGEDGVSVSVKLFSRFR